MIRNITDSDFEFIFNLYMHPSVNTFLLYEMMDKEAFKPIFDELLNQNIIYIFSENELNIGMFKFIPLQHRNCHMAYLGGVAIDPSFSGSGFGSKMFAEIIELGRKKGIKRIELSVATYNQKAIKLYEKHGFVKEGILRNYTFLISENRYIDEQMMAYLY